MIGSSRTRALTAPHLGPQSTGLPSSDGGAPPSSRAGARQSTRVDVLAPKAQRIKPRGPQVPLELPLQPYPGFRVVVFEQNGNAFSFFAEGRARLAKAEQFYGRALLAVGIQPSLRKGDGRSIVFAETPAALVDVRITDYDDGSLGINALWTAKA